MNKIRYVFLFFLFSHLSPVFANLALQQAIDELDTADQNRRALPHLVQSSVWSGDDPEQTEQAEYLPEQSPQLLLANGQTPSAKEIRQFNRRTSRESSEPPFRFVIDPDTLVLEHSNATEQSYLFQPVFYEADESTSYGKNFVGRLVFDTANEKITQLTYTLAEPFRYKIFTIEALFIDTHYQRIGERLVPAKLKSDVKMKNLVLNIDFSVQAVYLYR